MKKLLLTLLVYFSLLSLMNAQENVPDSITNERLNQSFKQNKVLNNSLLQKFFRGELNWNFIITPLVGYQPETSWAFGVAGAYYIKSKEKEGKTGIIGFNGAYTLNKQWNININSTIYFDKKQKWFLYLNTGFRHYPDYFFGIGNNFDNLLHDSVGKLSPINYNSNRFYLTMQPQYYIWKNWILGLNLNVRFEEINDLSGNFENRYDIKCLDKLSMIGLGGLISYDSRNNFFYPTKGLFLKGVATYYEKFLGSSYRMGKLNIDFRQYINLYKNLIFAYQFITEWTFTEANQRPFQMLSTFGGLEIMRGIRENVWRDDVMAAMQAELRIPVWKIFKLSAFCNIGDVYNLKKWDFAVPKIGYGVGLRVQFNNSNSHLRIDVARQNYDNKFYWYVTVNEAF